MSARFGEELGLPVPVAGDERDDRARCACVAVRGQAVADVVHVAVDQELLGDLAGVPGEIAVLISLVGFLSYVFWGMVGAVIYVCSGSVGISRVEND